MKRTIWTGTCTAVVGLATAALMAQTSAPQQSSAQSSDRRVTITGCLKAAPGGGEAAGAAAAGTTGTTGTAGTTGATGTAGAAEAGAANYVLTDASVKPAEAAAAPTTPAETTAAPSATTPDAGSGQTYRLIANPAALTPHVGKKLELTGTLENENGSSGAAAGSSATTGTTGTTTAGSEAKGPALRVESGKVVAASCSQ